MTCKHLRALEEAIIAAGTRETYRGRSWSKNCREWVYFDCAIDVDAVRRKFALAVCVAEHTHQGTHDGEERGLVCNECHDGVMGYHTPRPSAPVFIG